MSEFYVFIATKTTYERVIPTANVPQQQFNRALALAFQDINGGTIRAGELKLMPLSTAIPNHILCDGSELAQEAFPELYGYLGDTQGAAAAGMFKLPDYVTAFDASTTAPTQTVEGGTVSTGGTVTQPSGQGQAGGSVGGNVPSGGRYIGQDRV